MSIYIKLFYRKSHKLLMMSGYSLDSVFCCSDEASIAFE